MIDGLVKMVEMACLRKPRRASVASEILNLIEFGPDFRVGRGRRETKRRAVRPPGDRVEHRT